jgi:C-5 cytosine-specific DNA methylase
MRMLDLFCGRWGWSKAFAARGWECVGIDLIEPPETPIGCRFFMADILNLASVWEERPFDFICASPPCEQFSVHGMKHFHPNPPYPTLGIKLFEHTRRICEESGVPHVIENVKSAQKFIGQAKARCGSFYLWGNGVPPIMMQGIRKGSTQMRRDGRYKRHGGVDELMYMEKKERARSLATIPPELANCVAHYAERIIEQRKVS